MDLQEIERIADSLRPQLKDLGREWYRDSIIVCLRHGGKCEYCGYDLLSSQAICYHFWCIDHLLPQVDYPELKDHLENKVLSCRSCNSIKSDWDPNDGHVIHYCKGVLTVEQRGELLKRAKEYVKGKNTRLAEKFGEELALLRKSMEG